MRVGVSRARIRRAVAAWLRLARFFNTQHQLLGAGLRDSGLSVAQFDVVAQIGVCEGQTQKELAERLVVTQGNVTQLLQKLERQGLVERPPSGRCNRLRLTDAGRRIRDAVVPVHEDAIAGLFSRLTDQELEILSRLLRKVAGERPGTPGAPSSGPEHQGEHQ